MYYFLLDDNRDARDAHRFDFLDIKQWQPNKKSVGAKKAAALADFISTHRAHISMGRFNPPYLVVPKLTAKYLGGIVLDYLDILDDFIAHLPDTRESGKKAWAAAAYGPRYRTEVGLGLRKSDYPDTTKPFKSVVTQ